MKKRSRSAFGLIEILVVLVIICIIAAIMIPKIAGRSGSADKKKHTPIERAHDTAGLSYESQITQAIMMYRDDNEGRNPPNLQALSKYGVVPEMMVDQVTRQQLAYYPATGSIGDKAKAELAQTPGVPPGPGGVPGTAPGGPPPRRNVGPGGVTMPNIPQPNADAGEDQ